ncbi:HofP DNA utilization family protein [Intestinirhabdus alba]|jgi:pilus assembly protein HofP|uniref:DUF2531 family protein n=1 Tax=Intestinirhabdus alba TaxID=2899544 RepID=A0A6L6IQF5_9ENTR|nr:HofP DNA utilization family protein [Intestinirhabdus alba]MTH47726.1 DUF2531 family protein [Intestinirhabdus alba]
MRRLLAGVSLLLLTGLRDPFQPPVDHCRTGELAGWRYQGVVSCGARPIALVRDSAQRWHRVERNDVLENGWTVSRVTMQSITLINDKKCDPPRWRWQRQGEEVDEAMDRRGADGGSLQRTGGKSAQRHPGGG